MIKWIVPLIILLFLASAAYAQGRPLTEAEVGRVKALKQLIREVDTKPLQQTIDELDNTKDPLFNLQMREAMAKTYADIVQEQKVDDQAQKEWLYSMVALNMADLQFGSGNDVSGNGLNRLIRRKIKQYLSADVFANPGFHISVE